MNQDEAIAKADSKWWAGKSAKEIVDFQLYEDRLCMPFDLFQQAVEEVLNRPVWAHEFCRAEGLQAEYEGKRPPEHNPIASAERIIKG